MEPRPKTVLILDEEDNLDGEQARAAKREYNLVIPAASMPTEKIVDTLVDSIRSFYPDKVKQKH